MAEKLQLDESEPGSSGTTSIRIMLMTTDPLKPFAYLYDMACMLLFQNTAHVECDLQLDNVTCGTPVNSRTKTF